MLGVGLLLSSLLAPAAQGDDLTTVLAAERERIDVMRKVSPAVCSVMQLKAPGGGSGVIFDPLGFVLTNFHVVGKPNVERMKIGLPDGELYFATVLGIDPGSDLAVLLIDPRDDEKPWPYADLGDSDALLVGEEVFAMGNPFLLATDFKPTVTWGIVSGTHRYQPGPGNRNLVYPDCIQIDAPVNPGNSGGPLFHMNGEIVGINGRISVRDRGRVNVGVGFAIASNQIRNFVANMMAGRFTEHGTLDLNARYQTAPGEPDRRAVIVQAIFEDSTAADHGLRLGDELTRFNDTEINSANQLATLVGVMPAGAWVRLGYRPQQGERGYGDEREVQFRLNRLDTGSSRQPDRIATTEHRKLAARAVLRRLPDAEPIAGATLEMSGPDEQKVVLKRLGDKLRIDFGDHSLVRTASGEGFRLDPDGARDLTAEERAKLDRVFSANPWLWGPAGLRERIANGLLDGGEMVFGKPVFRIALDGDGQREIWLFEDGSPAGCRYRDPVQKALVELRVRDGRTRLLLDEAWKPGWSIAPPSHSELDASWFERPAR